MADQFPRLLDAHVRAKQPTRVPIVMSRDEARRVWEAMTGTARLSAMEFYGSGTRLMQACTLRVKDVDLDRHELIVRHGKGGRDRLTMLPNSLVTPLRAQVATVGALHRRDRAAGRAAVALPDAVRHAGQMNRVSCHTFRHWFATHLLGGGYDIRTLQDLLGTAA